MKHLLKIFFLVASLLQSKNSFSQLSCNAAGDVFVFLNYDGGHLTIDADMNIPGIKIGIRSYERTEVTIIGTYSANIDTIMVRGYNGGNNHCPPAIATNTVIQKAPATVALYGTGYGYNYNCASVVATHTNISQFTNGSAARLRGYVSWYECWCNPQKLSIAAAYCCKGAYSCFTALPLQLISFESVLSNEKGKHLKWETKNEVNFDRFEVEASDNAEKFIKVGEVKSKPGNQNSGAKYNFVDHSKVYGSQYYRLKMVDKDNMFRYSDIVFADATKPAHTFEIKNTLIEHEIELQSNIESQTIEIINSNGIRMKKIKITETDTKIPFDDVPPGMYFIMNDERTQILKLIKP